MKEGRITEECWIELYHTCKSVLDNHGDDPEAAKAWVEKVFESCENISRQVHELFLKAIDLIHDLEKKKAASPPRRPKQRVDRTKHNRNRLS